MKTAELTGALLDYWVGRAEDVPAPQLFFYQTPYTVETVCGRHVLNGFPAAVRYSTDWAQGGPLIEKYRMYVDGGDLNGWATRTGPDNMASGSSYGDAPLQAICRAVVRAAFGDEVEEVAV